jgi:hypothetical protein
MHYVSVIESFKNLIQDSSFLAMEERNIVPELETLGDVKDGELYKQNPFFMANPSAYTMMLYSDAIELVNPLGAGRGKHKVIQIFFSLCEISKHLRSKIDRIQLVAVFKEKLIKKYGFKKLYEQLVKDLKKLEEGVVVDFPVKRVVKCGVLIHPCDNLEAHTVGGFSQSFSSGFICRFCHIKHKDLLDNIHDYGDHPHAKWTCMEYDRAALAAEKKIQDAAGDGDAAEEELYTIQCIVVMIVMIVMIVIALMTLTMLQMKMIQQKMLLMVMNHRLTWSSDLMPCLESNTNAL